MESKLKHLEFIQNVINRMANNSFIIKGWCVTIISALFALSEKENSQSFAVISLLPIMAFGILDAYFLKLEREYRRLYNTVRKQNENEINFSMDIQLFKIPIIYIIISKTIFWFYVPLVIIVFIFFVNFC